MYRTLRCACILLWGGHLKGQDIEGLDCHCHKALGFCLEQPVEWWVTSVSAAMHDNHCYAFVDWVQHQWSVLCNFQVTGVGYSTSGQVLCNNEVVRENTHPSISKLMEVWSFWSWKPKAAMSRSLQIVVCANWACIITTPFVIPQCKRHVGHFDAFQIGVLCNNAQIWEDSLRGQPTEGAILACAMKVQHICTL